MADILASPVDIGARLRSGRFWLRVTAGIGLGHVYGAIGFAAVLALQGFASKYGPLRLLMEGATLPQVVLRIPTKALHVAKAVPSLALFAAVYMVPVTLLSVPAPIAAALVLKTGRAASMLVGAVAALLVGWPLSIAVYGFLTAGDAVVALCGVGAGAMFGLGLWQCCLARYVSSTGQLNGLARWWTSLSLGIKAAFVAVPLLLLLLW